MNVRNIHVSEESGNTANLLAAAHIEATDEQTAAIKDLALATWTVAAVQRLAFYGEGSMIVSGRELVGEALDLQQSAQFEHIRRTTPRRPRPPVLNACAQATDYDGHEACEDDSNCGCTCHD